MTGRENVYMNGTILGMRKFEIDRKFDEIVEFSGVTKFLDTPIKRYSSGMKVRLAFAVAAHLEPEILIIDEVLAVGDAEFQKKCLGKMENVASSGRTVLFVSHNMPAVNNLCSRVIWLQAGCIRESGPADQIIREYLADGSDAASELVYPPEHSKAAQVTSIRALDAHDRPVFEHSSAQPLKIQYDFEVREPVERFVCALKITTSTGETLLVSTEADCASQEGRYRPLGRELGEYQASVTIHPPFFNRGAYFFTPLLTAPGLAKYDSPQALRVDVTRDAFVCEHRLFVDGRYPRIQTEHRARIVDSVGAVLCVLSCLQSPP